MNPVIRKQIADWIESPITALLKQYLTEERASMQASKGLNAFHPFEPQRTQELLSNLNGYVDALDVVIDTLDGEGLWSEEDDEQIGDNTLGQ